MAEHWDSRRELLVDEADIIPMALGHLQCVFNLCLRELYTGALYIAVADTGGGGGGGVPGVEISV